MKLKTNKLSVPESSADVNSGGGIALEPPIGDKVGLGVGSGVAAGAAVGACVGLSVIGVAVWVR